jgi:hypothetical protein
MTMKKDEFQKYGLSALICLCVIGAVLVAPAAAAGTTSVTVTKYCDNNYSAVANSATISWSNMTTDYDNVVSNGDIYMQGPVFEDEWVAAGFDINNYSIWDENEKGVNLVSYGGHNGTSISDLVGEVGGMNAGDEIAIRSVGSKTYSSWFSGSQVNNPDSDLGDLVLTWWDSVDGNVPTWDIGMRLYFYNSSVNNFTNWDMHESLPSWYWKNYTDRNTGDQYPSAKGLSVKMVNTIDIYPAHRYDFATGGDTVEYAYEGEVNGTPTVNEPSLTTVDTSKIATVDNVFETTSSTNDGKFAAQRFVFDLSEDAANIEKLAFTWTGTGSHESGDPADQGATTYIWKNNVGYMPLSSVTTGISDYVVNGDVTVLVKQNAASSGGDASSLSTDYVKLVVTHHHSN